MSIDRTQLGHTIRRLRKEAGLTQGQLANKLGITNGAICNFEQGRGMPSVTTLAEMARTLGVGYGVLFGDRLALAEHAVNRIRAEVRALGYDLALIPREDA